ncbi:MAG: hypothetical protein DRP97_04340 [Candidatus Latescibacterota bacterium]|nr:MAG: hypothetical protein DRP97_04340 [Candidatus Latescibacterota bacterium]
MRAIRFFCLLCLLTYAGTGSAWAAGESNARSMGMGGAYTGVARNLDALDWNPANLGLSGGRSVVVGLPGMGFAFGNNVLSTGVYERYNGKYLTEKDKSDILYRIQDGWRFDTSFRCDVFGLSVGRIGVKHWVEFASDFSLTQAPFEMLFRGTEAGKTISLDDLGAELALLDVTALSYAYPIPLSLVASETERFGVTELAVGATVKYIVGGAYAKLETPEGRLVFDEYVMHGNGEAWVETAGVTWNLGSDKEDEDPDFHAGKIGGGFALDLGAAAVLNNNLTVSVGLLNLIGGVTWDTDCERAVFSFQADSLNVVAVAEDTTDGDALYASSDTSYSIGSFESNLPAVLNVGAACRLNIEENGLLGLHPSPWLVKDVVVAMDWRQGLSNGLGVSTTPRIALGIENKTLRGIIPLRYGVALGGSKDIVQTVGCGLVLGSFRWDTAWENRGHWPFVSSKGFSWATRFQLAF